MKRKTPKIKDPFMLMHELPENWIKVVRKDFMNSGMLFSKSGMLFTKPGYKSQLLDESYYDVGGAMKKRREQALIRSVNSLPDKWKPLFSDWIMLNMNNEGYMEIEQQSHLLYAASIWILDKLLEIETLEMGKPIEELYKLLPSSIKEISEFSRPEIWDSQYSNELLESVEYVLHYRNKDIAPLEEDGRGGYRVLTSHLSAEGKNHADVPSRRCFESLLGLIPQESKDLAVKHFQEYYQQWVERYFSAVEPLNKKSQDLYVEVRELADSLQRIKRNMPVVPDARFFGAEELTDEMMDIIGKRVIFSEQMSHQGCLKVSECKEIFGEDVAEQLTPLHFTNPYELCFALLYLIETDDDIPWLYGACIGLVREISFSLPWSENDTPAILQTAKMGTFPWISMEERTAESDFDKEFSTTPLYLTDWYKKAYSIESEDKSCNLAQIIYASTGCIMPRMIQDFKYMMFAYDMYGIPKDTELSMLYCMSTLNNAKNRIQAMNLDPDYTPNIDEPVPENAKPEIEENTEPSDLIEQNIELKAQINELKKRIRDLKSAQYRAEKAANDTQMKLIKLTEDFEAERRELADLREIMFKGGIEETQEETGDISRFPYNVKRNTLIFGGHDSWMKAIKPILTGNIRLVPREMLFDTSIIRNAEVIWIQPNSMPHTTYYRITKEARQYNKPIRYFTFASAIKCAEQLVENDT